jgi:hypothetical protein
VAGGRCGASPEVPRASQNLAHPSTNVTANSSQLGSATWQFWQECTTLQEGYEVQESSVYAGETRKKEAAKGVHNVRGKTGLVT